MNNGVINFLAGRKQILILFFITVILVLIFSFTSFDEKISFSLNPKNNSDNSAKVYPTTINSTDMGYDCNYVWPQQIINKTTGTIIKICPMSNPYCKAGTTQCCNYNFATETHYNCINALTNQPSPDTDEEDGTDEGNEPNVTDEGNEFDDCEEACESINLAFGFNADSSDDCFFPDTYHVFGTLKCCCSLPSDGGISCDDECKMLGWDAGLDSSSLVECEDALILIDAETGDYTDDGCCCYNETEVPLTPAEQVCYDWGYDSGRGPVATPYDCYANETAKQFNNQPYCCWDYIGISQAGCDEVLGRRTGLEGVMYNPAWNAPTNECRDWAIAFCPTIGQSISIWFMEGGCCFADCYIPPPPPEPPPLPDPEVTQNDAKEYVVEHYPAVDINCVTNADCPSNMKCWPSGVNKCYYTCYDSDPTDDIYTLGWCVDASKTLSDADNYVKVEWCSGDNLVQYSCDPDGNYKWADGSQVYKCAPHSHDSCGCEFGVCTI